MTRIEPDGMVPKWRNHLAPNPGMALVEEPAFVRSTVLRAIDEEVATWDILRTARAEIAALRRLRARFQPTEEENGHE